MGKKSPPQIDPATLQKLLSTLGVELKTMTDIEGAIARLTEAVAQQGADTLLDLEPDDDTPKPCPKCGSPIRVRKKNVGRTIEALSGQHTIFRNYHYCEHCRFGFYPKDDALGLPREGSVTFELEKRLADFAVNDSYESCARRWKVHYPRAFSATLFERVASRIGKRLEQCAPHLAQRSCMPGKQKSARRLYVMNDGGMIPMRHGWREVKLGVVFRDEDHVAGTPKRRRGFIERARYVGVLGDQNAFKEELRAALDVERWRRSNEVIWIGDGALGNWTLAESLAPLSIQILDVQHAIENGVNCGKALLGENSPLIEAWHKRIEQLVYQSDVDALVRELLECWLETDNVFASKAIGKLVGYYRNNQGRMDYATYRTKGYMIGSGVIESAHRHVIQSRMKKAGQHWSEKHGGRMVRLRAAYSTAGPERFHDAINIALCRTHLAQKRAALSAA